VRARPYTSIHVGSQENSTMKLTRLLVILAALAVPAAAFAATNSGVLAHAGCIFGHCPFCP
jgi:hypothetical protein